VLGNKQVLLYHDGVRWHDSPPPAQALRDENVLSLGKPPARSPCMNPIENLFGYAEQRLEDRWIGERSSSPADTRARFDDICTDSGDIRRTAGSMPKRMKLVIDAKGGPIRY